MKSIIIEFRKSRKIGKIYRAGKLLGWQLYVVNIFFVPGSFLDSYFPFQSN